MLPFCRVKVLVQNVSGCAAGYPTGRTKYTCTFGLLHPGGNSTSGMVTNCTPLPSGDERTALENFSFREANCFSMGVTWRHSKAGGRDCVEVQPISHRHRLIFADESVRVVPVLLKEELVLGVSPRQCLQLCSSHRSLSHGEVLGIDQDLELCWMSTRIVRHLCLLAS